MLKGFDCDKEELVLAKRGVVLLPKGLELADCEVCEGERKSKEGVVADIAKGFPVVACALSTPLVCVLNWPNLTGDYVNVSLHIDSIT